MENNSKKPLKGVRVLDLSNLLPGPYCSYLLQQMGAEVIKIEHKNGDGARKMVPGLFDIVNYGKKSIVLDLKQKEAVQIFKKAAARADVILEGFRPQVKYKLGIDYETIKSINPKIIYCSISGYGQTGDLKNTPGHDINYLSLAGVYSLSGDPNGPPSPYFGIAVADIAASMVAFSSILLALRSRDIYGIGDYIDVSMTDSALSMMINRVGEYTTVNDPDIMRQRMLRPAYGIFKTKDNQYIAIGALEDHFWEQLCHLFEWNEYLSDPEYSSMEKRISKSQKINESIQNEILQRECVDWIELMNNHDIPASKVNSIADLETDNYIKERGILSFSDGNALMKFPALFSNMEMSTNSDSPKLGEHTQSVLSELGYSNEDIRKFMREEIIM